MLKRLLRHPATLALGAGLIGRYLEFAFRTTRWQLVGLRDAAPGTPPGTPADTVEAAVRSGQPVIVSFWHERLPLMSRLWRAAEALFPEARGRSPHVLVSRHRDGRFIGDIVERFGFTMVHGSTSRGGAAGMAALLRALEAGNYAAITPDGPRGPRRVAAPGIAQLAAVSGVPVIPCAARTTRARVLPSWDRMVLPLPFGRGVVVVRPPIRVPRDGAEAALPLIAAAMDEACEIADRWCRGEPLPEGVAAGIAV